MNDQSKSGPSTLAKSGGTSIAPPSAEDDGDVEPHLLEQVERVIDRQLPRVIAATLKETTVGPIPPPRFLDHYEKILPGMAERLVAAYEAEGVHRRNMEALDGSNERSITKVIADEDVRSSKAGQWMAFFVTIGGLAGACYVAISTDHGWAAGVIGVAALGGPLGAQWMKWFVGRKLLAAQNQAENNGAK